jgi:hypothetical protein
MKQKLRHFRQVVEKVLVSFGCQPLLNGLEENGGKAIKDEDEEENNPEVDLLSVAETELRTLIDHDDQKEQNRHHVHLFLFLNLREFREKM